MTEPLLSICICAIQSRIGMLGNLLRTLQKQIERNGNAGLVEVLINLDNKEKTTGKKRQELLEQAKGKYVIAIDEDDTIDDEYISLILAACATGVDAIPINGWIETDGANRIYWRISKDYDNVTIMQNGMPFYQRKVNHICAIKKSLALQAGFNDTCSGEDKFFSEKLCKLLETELVIEKPIYFYHYQSFNKEY